MKAGKSTFGAEPDSTASPSGEADSVGKHTPEKIR